MSTRLCAHNNVYHDHLKKFILSDNSSSIPESTDLIRALSIFISLTDSAFVYNPPFLVSKYEKMQSFKHSASEKHNSLVRVATELLKDESVRYDIQKDNAEVYLKVNNLWEVDLVSFGDDPEEGISLCDGFSFEDAFCSEKRSIYTLLWESPQGFHSFAIIPSSEEEPPKTDSPIDKIIRALFRIIVRKENIE